MTSESVFSDRRRITALVVAVVLLVGVITWLALRSPATTSVEPQVAATIAVSSTAPSPSLVTSAPVSSTPSEPPASPTPSPTGFCQPMTDEGFEPVRYEIERFKTDEEVVSLGVDADGAIAAPPKSEPRTASWWNQGPAAGTDAGKTVLSIHTYRSGGALGNQMFEGGQSRLEPGDRIILRGPLGEVACYDFVEAKKVFVKDYDPSSDTMVDFDGTPLLTMIICWDHRKGTDLWDSRVFFYAQPHVGD